MEILFSKKKSFCNSSYETSTLACHSNQTFLYECRGQNFDLKYHHTPPGFHKSEKNTRRGKDSKNVKKSGDGEEGMWYCKKMPLN